MVAFERGGDDEARLLAVEPLGSDVGVEVEIRGAVVLAVDPLGSVVGVEVVVRGAVVTKEGGWLVLLV